MDENYTPREEKQDSLDNAFNRVQLVPAGKPEEGENFQNRPDFNSLQYVPQNVGSKGKSTASMILGICSIVLVITPYISIPCGIIGLVLGIIALRKRENGRGMAVAGIVTSSVGILLGILFTLMVVLSFILFTDLGGFERIEYYY